MKTKSGRRTNARRNDTMTEKESDSVRFYVAFALPGCGRSKITKTS